jgi:proteasome lid subunit RPN8/RPN11
VLELPQELVDRVVAHARKDHPDECCGVIAGAGGTATRLFEMTNAERSPTGFVFDSGEWLRVSRDIDDADEEPLVVYHSHTATEAYPRAPTSGGRRPPASRTGCWCPPARRSSSCARSRSRTAW